MAKDGGMWDSDLQILHKALMYSKNALISNAKQLSVEVRKGQCCLVLLVDFLISLETIKM